MVDGIVTRVVGASVRSIFRNAPHNAVYTFVCAVPASSFMFLTALLMLSLILLGKCLSTKLGLIQAFMNGNNTVACLL